MAQFLQQIFENLGVEKDMSCAIYSQIQETKVFVVDEDASGVDNSFNSGFPIYFRAKLSKQVTAEEVLHFCIPPMPKLMKGLRLSFSKNTNGGEL